MQLWVKDAARILNVSEDTIIKWVEERGLPAYLVNRQYRFNRAEILEWATSTGMAISSEINKGWNTMDERPSLADALSQGGVHKEVPGHNRDTVLRSIVDLLDLPINIDRDFLFRVLLAREDMGSTGIGNGIGIPHPRSPIVLGVEMPYVTLCYLKEAIDYNAIDGKPVQVLFTLISPTVQTHLHLLSRLAYIIQNNSFREALSRQAGLDEIVTAVRDIERSLPWS